MGNNTTYQPHINIGLDLRKTKFDSGENTVQDPDPYIKVEVGDMDRDVTMKTNVNKYTYRGSKYHCEA